MASATAATFRRLSHEFWSTILQQLLDQNLGGVAVVVPVSSEEVEDCLLYQVKTL